MRRQREASALETLYADIVYQPMLEVMQHPRANRFKAHIVTGGGQRFVSAYAEHVYGIPPQHVIGSSLERSSDTIPMVKPYLCGLLNSCCITILPASLRTSSSSWR